MKLSKSEKTFNAVNLTLLIIFAVLWIYPIIHVLFASFSSPDWVRENRGLILYPHGFTLEGYKMVFTNKLVFKSILNSLVYLVTGVALNMVLTLMGAFVLSRKGVMLNKFFMIVITITMFFGGGLIPLYMLLNDLNMLNNISAIIVPVAVSPWNMIIMRTAFQGVPEEILDSAKIDGAGHMTLLVKISLPLAKATAAIIFLYYAVGHWNSWFPAMAFLRDRDKYPLQLIIQELLVINDTSNIIPGGMDGTQALNAGVLVQYCTVVVSMVPIMIIFPFVQKNFSRGVLVGSIK